jgi:hypothetical protein
MSNIASSGGIELVAGAADELPRHIHAVGLDE